MGSAARNFTSVLAFVESVQSLELQVWVAGEVTAVA